MKRTALLAILIASFGFSQNRTVTFISAPESSRIFINGILRGITPLTTDISEDVHSHKTDIKMLRPGCLPFSLLIPFSELTDTIATELQRAASLTVVAAPENASVYIDSIWYGKSPLSIDTLTPRSIILTVIKQNYALFSEQITIEPGSHHVYRPVLEPLRSSISINGTPGNLIYTLDENIPLQQYEKLDVLYGSHTLSVRDTVSGEVAEQNIVVADKNPRIFRAAMKQFSFSKTVTGLIVPSWNQFADGAGNKGIIFAAAAVGSVLYYVHSQYQYTSADKDFLDAQNVYSNLSNKSSNAKEARIQLDNTHAKVVSATTTLNTARMVTIAVWVLNGLDILLNHTTVNSIEELPGNISLGYDARQRKLTTAITIPF